MFQDSLLLQPSRAKQQCGNIPEEQRTQLVKFKWCWVQQQSPTFLLTCNGHALLQRHTHKVRLAKCHSFHSALITARELNMAAGPVVQAVPISYCTEGCVTLKLTNSKTKDSTSIIQTWINIVFTASLLDNQ
jgi:hypothetical protein